MTDDCRRVAALALAEDGERDLTTEVTVDAGLQGQGPIEFRSGGVLAGTGYADAVVELCECRMAWQHREGDRIPPRAAAGTLSGSLRQVLKAERPLLNLLQRASGIATLTRQYVDRVAGTSCRILHTRKTAPGLRALDLAAVVAGGGHLHRADLAHLVMVKDNHWRALARTGRSLASSIEEARRLGAKRIYVEVENEEQLELACHAKADRLLVDNQAPETVRRWAQIARGLRPGIEIEATGGITLENVRAYADTSADFISIGALTHSVEAADIALEII